MVTVVNPYDDVQQGGDGDDTSFGGSGDDYISGGAGDDRLFGRDGADRLFGGTGADRIMSGTGNDFIDAGEGDDLVFGGDGDDVIYGGAGDDMLFGGAGLDTFHYRTGDGRDRIQDYQTPQARRRSFIAGDEIVLGVEGIESFEDLMAVASQEAGGVLFDFGNGDELFLAGTRLAALDQDKFSFY